jgi:hypothetical protein
MQLSLPTWLKAMMESRTGAAEGIRWFTLAECAASAQRRPTAFPARSFWVSDEQRAAADQGWENTVQVAAGPDTYEDHSASVRSSRPGRPGPAAAFAAGTGGSAKRPG